MKKNLFISILLLLPFLINAQQNQGTIVYETRSSASLSMNGVEQKMPMRIAKNELLFMENKSLFKNIPITDEDQKFQNGNSSIGFQTNNSLRITYHDFDKKERLRTKELGTKKYIEQGSIPDLNWVIGEETKTILGLPCKKATGKLVNKDWLTSVSNNTVTITPKIDTITVYAWFTNSIPLPIGPDRYTGLPGAIMLVENNKGRILFEAVSVNEMVKQKNMQPPLDGKLISQEDFYKEDRDYREKSTKAMNGL